MANEMTAMKMLAILAVETSALSDISYFLRGCMTSSVSMVAALLISELNELKTAPKSTAKKKPSAQTGSVSLTNRG